MLSARGAITTSVAMVECASGQNVSNKDLFLLSELEKVWVALAVVLRRTILNGKGVQIPYFGSFATQEKLLAVDLHRRRYCTRSLCFSINGNFATRYGVDMIKVAVEKPDATPARVHIAEVVALCSVPARTAQAALREFILYLGEGLHQGRVFQIVFPGFATLTMKKERVMLTIDDGLRMDLFNLDARRWSSEMREHCRNVLEAEQPSRPSTSTSSSRPSSRLSRASWRQEATVEPRQVFIAACPSGRLFEDIAKNERRRRELEEAKLQERQAAGFAHRDRASTASGVDSLELPARPSQQTPTEADTAPRVVHCNGPPGTPVHESVYKLVAPQDEHAVQSTTPAAGTPNVARHSGGDEANVAKEPEIEAVVEMNVGPNVPHTRQPCVPPRPLGDKDAELEALLRQEEPFTRPISRQVWQEGNSARDLIYGRSDVLGASRTQPADHEVASQHYGRRRFDHPHGESEVQRLCNLLKLSSS